MHSTYRLTGTNRGRAACVPSMSKFTFAEAAPSQGSSSTILPGPITKIPPEVLSEIFSHLYFWEIRRARSVCRGFTNCVWLHFGATFKYTTFDLRSIASMRNLANISNHPLLAPHIDTLKIAAGHVDKDLLQCVGTKSS
jgi:hypothetical protein